MNRLQNHHHHHPLVHLYRLNRGHLLALHHHHHHRLFHLIPNKRSNMSRPHHHLSMLLMLLKYLMPFRYHHCHFLKHLIQLHQQYLTHHRLPHHQHCES